MSVTDGKVRPQGKPVHVSKVPNNPADSNPARIPPPRGVLPGPGEVGYEKVSGKVEQRQSAPLVVDDAGKVKLPGAHVNILNRRPGTPTSRERPLIK
jgi:hypothetical protein